MTAGNTTPAPARVALEELTPTIVAAFANDTCLVWSCEHQAYWRAHGHGYVSADYDAGRFTLAGAYARTKHCGPSKGIMFERAADKVEHLKKQLDDERKLTRRLGETNQKLAGAVEAAPPIALTAGSWWYPDGDTSSDSCMFAPAEVVDQFVEGFDGRAGVCVIERAVSLPDVYAAVRVLTEDECELLGVDDEVSYTLYPTREAAADAVAAMLNEAAGADPASPNLEGAE